MQPFLFHSGRPLMQPVLLTAGAPAAFATTVRPPLAAVAMKPEPQSQLLHPPPVPPPPPVELYLCGTTQTATEPPAMEGERERASLEFVEKSYQELNSKKIKDSLSAFLDDIPGEFDSVESETMLRHLIDHRPIGGKEFHPLTGQALLGFRLLPGALPEQYRMDPPSREPKPHHRKRKHKHKSLDRTEDSSDIGPPPTQAKLPSDAYNFIRQEPPASGLHAPPSHSLTNPMVVQSKVITGPGHLPYQPTMGAIPNIAAAPAMMADPTRSSIFDPQKRKKKKRDKDKERKKDKKEKKKKREKHHSQDPPGVTTAPPPLVSHPPAPASYPQFPPT